MKPKLDAEIEIRNLTDDGNDSCEHSSASGTEETQERSKVGCTRDARM